MSRVSLADWDDLWFIPDEGELPDVWAKDSTAADWQRVFDAMRARGWRMKVNDQLHSPVPDRIETVRPNTPDDDHYMVAVFPHESVQANFFIYFDEVGFDIALAEVTTQAALDALCDLIETVSSATGNDVYVCHEGDDDQTHAVLWYRAAAREFELTPYPHRSGRGAERA